jgi:hypothetical protein
MTNTKKRKKEKKKKKKNRERGGGGSRVPKQLPARDRLTESDRDS